MINISIIVDGDSSARNSFEKMIAKINSGFNKELEVISRRMKQDIKEHFDKTVDQDGRIWEPRRGYDKSRKSRGNWPLLNRTGTGKSASSDNAIVKISSNSMQMRIASFAPSRKLKGKAQPKRSNQYMPYHKTGTSKMVARNFAYASQPAINDSMGFIARTIIRG